MDFERVLRDLAGDFTARKVPYALIGGFAMGTLGIGRSTMDWERMREYFALFGRLELYEEIREAHGPAERG